MTGTRYKYNGQPIRRMVDLLAGEPDLSYRSAALQIAEEQRVEDPERYVEGLRRHYRFRKARGDLPLDPNDPAARDAVVRVALTRAFDMRRASIENARRRVEELKSEAAVLGIDDTTPEGLEALATELESSKEKLSRAIRSPIDAVIGRLMQRFSTPEAAHEEYLRLRQELEQVEKKERLIAELQRSVGFLENVGASEGGET